MNRLKFLICFLIVIFLLCILYFIINGKTIYNSNKVNVDEYTNGYENIKIIRCEMDNSGLINIEVKEDSLNRKGITIIFSSDDEFTYSVSTGDDYILSKLENQQWKELDKSNNWNTTEALNVKSDIKEIEENIEWLRKYGELKNGTYKLERIIHINKTSSKILIEFEII